MKVVVAVGTRPEMIKMAPVIEQFRADSRFDTKVLFTAQHRDMLDQMAAVFGIAADCDLNLMKSGQTPTEFLSNCIAQASKAIQKLGPDLVLVQGDTSTVLAMALVCALEKVALGHVEAGLRTYKKHSPFPEEINRQMTSVAADLHFAPTPWAADNLRNEHVPPSQVHVVGNTVVDAVSMVVDRVGETRPGGAIGDFLATRERYILVTTHRRENFGEPLRRICTSINRIAKSHPELGIILPVHPNPNVRGVVREMLGGLPNLLLCDPIDYFDFIRLLRNCSLALTDSGGVQEEAPSFRVPVVLMREDTERPEGVEIGITKLVGTDEERIVSAVGDILGSTDYFQAVGCRENPYGDGRASQRIRDISARYLMGR